MGSLGVVGNSLSICRKVDTYEYYYLEKLFKKMLLWKVC